MPELPEVETVCRGLEKAMKGRAVTGVTLNREGLRIPFPPQLAKLKGVRVTGIARRAKYILIDFDDGRTMIVHLGMSGRMTVDGGGEGKHDHMILTLDDGRRVVFTDPRRFGLVDLVKTAALEVHRFFRHLGPEPLDGGFTPAHLATALRDKKTAVKIAIMDQRVVVGVGNIYAAEALFEARIDPRREGRTLTAGEVKRLAAAIKNTLTRAIAAGGSSLRDYVQADGALGYFQHHWAVYGKAGEACPSCKKPCILKITQGGRSTFYCPARQQ